MKKLINIMKKNLVKINIIIKKLFTMNEWVQIIKIIIGNKWNICLKL